MDPDFVPGRWVLGQAYEQKGMLSEAVAELERAVSLSGGSPVFRASLARAYAVSGRKTEALKLVDDLNEDMCRRMIWPWLFPGLLTGTKHWPGSEGRSRSALPGRFS